MEELLSLNRHLGIHDIRKLCDFIEEPSDNDKLSQLYALIYSHDERLASNALWVLTHCKDDKLDVLQIRQNEMIDYVLSTDYIRIRRLLLVLLERQEYSADNIRSDFLDYCLDRINSCEPYAIRALCMKLAFKMCRFYPELIQELTVRLNNLYDSELSPGLRSAKKNILSRIGILERREK